MALPRAIQAQLEQANALLDAANKPADSTPPADPAPAAAPADNPSPTPPSDPPSSPVAAEPPANPAPQPDVWEHKYKTLQGLFNREVPTLQQEVKDLKSQLSEAVAKLNEAAQKKPSEPEAPKTDPRDVENFGSDLVDMVQRVATSMVGRAASEYQALAARLEQRVTQLEAALQGTTQTVAMTAEQSFFDRLTKLIPDWEQTNANDAFLAWLAEVDPILGQPRQVALNAAQQSLNAERAAAVFKAFAATQPVAPKSNPVDKQVSPKGAATAAPAPQQPIVLTQQQIVDFYNSKRRGEYRGNEAEAKRIEDMINLAIAEGRVR